MKPWEQGFKYIGILAVLLVVIFGVQQFVKTKQNQTSYANFKAVSQQMKAAAGSQPLTAAQMATLAQAAGKVVASRPTFQIGNSASYACSPGTAGCGTEGLCQDLAAEVWDTWESGGSDPLNGGGYQRAERAWKYFMELCY